MYKPKVINRKMEQDFSIFKEITPEFEEILRKEAFNQQDCYIQWERKFKSIYTKENANLNLYSIFTQIFYIAHLFVFQFILTDHEKLSSEQSFLEQAKIIQKEFLEEFSTDISFLNPYFLPLIDYFDKKNISILNNLKNFVKDNISEMNIKPEYFFDYLFQRAIVPLLRHISGEFYTPPFLVKMMVKDAYEFGDKVLDPSCGTGNFLIEIVQSILSEEKTKEEKMNALNNIYGFDINPISIFLTIINIVLLAKKKIRNLNSHFFILDSLFDEVNLNDQKFDLVIGNPPWYTFRDIDSVNYQNKIKNLAEDLEIKPSPKNILNIEISSLFLYKANKSFMKHDGKIFFVITKGVITGSHASRFRNFKGFKNIKIWTFENKIGKVFNIDFICLFARKTNNSNFQKIYPIPSLCFGLTTSTEQLNYFDELKLRILKQDTLVPYSIERKADKVFVHKLIPKKQYSDLIPIEQSIYKKQFHKGADLNPRNLIFIKFQLKNENLAIINPDERIFKRAKVPWDKKIFHDSIIEKEYIFKVIKSTELIKFHIFDFYHVFLPISKTEYDFNYSKLRDHAKSFYDEINEYYIHNKKATTKNKSLMDNLNRWSKLINERQFSKIKVVYNNSGSILSAAVVQGDFLVTGDLSFYATEILEEAYYLSAVLNSKLLNKQIKIKKSSRHIFKIPFEIPIQKYDPMNKSHQNLAQLGIQGEKLTKRQIKNLNSEKNQSISRYKLQNMLSVKLEPILAEIDEFLKPQFFDSK